MVKQAQEHVAYACLSPASPAISVPVWEFPKHVQHLVVVVAPDISVVDGIRRTGFWISLIILPAAWMA